MNSCDRFSTVQPLVAKFLIFLLVVGSATPVQGQEQAKPEPTQAVPVKPMSPLPTVQTLRILVLAGQGGQNDLQHGIMSPLVVQILDQNARPVEDAEVVFRFPQGGPGAAFAGQKTSQTTSTNGDGQAAASGWTANGQAGRFEVRVTALRRNEMGSATVEMENVPVIIPEKKKKRGFFSSRWTRIGLIAGGAAAAGIAIALTRNGGSATAPPVVVVPGAPTIGGPR